MDHYAYDVHIVDYKNCPTCNAPETYKEIAKKRAWKTAHILATKEAEKKDARFTPVQVYTLMFPVIYEHEYQRNVRVESERQSYALRMTHDKLCNYHGEFSREFCTKVHKEVEHDYSTSKWPNALKR